MKKIAIALLGIFVPTLVMQSNTTIVYYPESNGIEILQTIPIDYLGFAIAYEGKNTTQDVSDITWQQEDPITGQTVNHRYISGHQVLDQWFVGPLYHYKDIQTSLQLGAYRSDKACSYYYTNEVLESTDCQSRYNQGIRASIHYTPYYLKGFTLSMSYSSTLKQPNIGVGWRF